MNQRTSTAVAFACLVGWLLTTWTVEAQSKRIRLRNEEIVTSRPALAGAAAGQEDRVVSGLYLIQFTDHFEPHWRETLRPLGIDLLRYIPEDSFIARCQRVSLKRLHALPFVQWVGEYRPEHKVHRALRQQPAPGAPAAAPALQDVSVLLAPGVGAPELAPVRALLAAVQQESRSRFGAILRGKISRDRMDALSRSSAVLWIEPGPRIKLFDESSTFIVAGSNAPHVTVPQSLGLSGAGVKVAVADSGLHLGLPFPVHEDLDGRATNFFFYGALTDGSDEHGHGTHVAGIIAGDGATGEEDEFGNRYGLGVAPGAGIVTQRIFDGLGNYEPPPSFETLTRDAVGVGAEIGSNSWGDDTQGRYDLSAAEFDGLVRDADSLQGGDQPYILEFSAGNAGPGFQTIGSPALAKNVIATGSAQSDRKDLFIYEDGPDAMADFSSRGPCEDGRIKPDLVAPGTWIASLRSPVGDDNNAWAPISDNYLYMGGTSQAGPHASGAAALLVQYFRQTLGISNPSPALVKAALINSAIDMDPFGGTLAVPNMEEGWGRLNMADIFDGSRAYEFVEQGLPLTNTQVFERRIVVGSENDALKITLAYTDVPASPSALQALVNNLNLEVIGPDGELYRGNQFLDGESIPQAVTTDTLNNVEGVFLWAPAPGEYLLRVRAVNVAEDARIDTPMIDQDFALVASGHLVPPGIGLVILDRAAYTAPGSIRVKVIDTDQVGVPSLEVSLLSTTESTPELLLLRPETSGIAFTGTIATAVGPPTGDGVLQINHGDTIQALYFDVSEGAARTATAQADLVPPLVNAVYTTNMFGRVVVTWISDELVSGLVFFGTNPAALNLTATNREFLTRQEVSLGTGIPGATYYFFVVAIDAAGNLTTNDNGGTLFSFVAPSLATVLLVNAYSDDPNSPFIPVSSYTNAMARTGVSFDVWEVNQVGRTPTTAELLTYKIVMWRINDAFTQEARDTLEPADRQTIQEYLAGGGSFFMASMDILTLVLDGGGANFVTNVLHIAEFLRNPNPLGQCSDCDEDIGVPIVQGVPGDPTGSDIVATLDYTLYPEFEPLGLGPDFSDTFTPGTDAFGFLLSSANARPCGLKYPRIGQDGSGRVVFLSFPLDAVPETNPPPHDRATLLRNIFQFLAPGLGGLGSVELDRHFYSMNDRALVELADLDLAGQHQALVHFYSTSDSNRVPVTVMETPRAGLFRGFVPIIAFTNPPLAGRLRVRHLDTIYAEYFDASSSATVLARGGVDGLPPEVTNLAVTTDYEEAWVEWETSETADALVQYGESTFLGRTAYAREMDVSHSVYLAGLTPDRLYYYRVVSQDEAGNVIVDDNQGRLHTFRTRRPRDLPFFDDLENGGTNWSVFSSDTTQFTWTLGTPNNGSINDAFSPTNAWCSNLNGGSADEIDTLLISPAFNLVGGNSATLRFWHNYDFSERSEFDIFEGGTLLLITNSTVNPVTLAEFTDSNFGWERVELDLSPYIGRVIYLVWHHQLLSLASAPRPGWSIDDISLTITNVPPGTFQVTNNLAQARFVIGGPISRNGQGVLNTYTHAPPGRYIVTFGNVPWYETPLAETNLLAPGGFLVVTGLYTFTDLNSNQMSDAWETNYFQEVSPLRDRQTDTDHDGATDYAEFLAGTNPTDPNSRFRLLPPLVLTNSVLRVQWLSVAGRDYQVQGSSNCIDWMPLSDWLRGGASLTMWTIPLPTLGPYLFRVQVRP